MVQGFLEAGVSVLLFGCVRVVIKYLSATDFAAWISRLGTGSSALGGEGVRSISPAPFLTASIKARNEPPMRHCEEDGSFNINSTFLFESQPLRQ